MGGFGQARWKNVHRDRVKTFVIVRQLEPTVCKELYAQLIPVLRALIVCNPVRKNSVNSRREFKDGLLPFFRSLQIHWVLNKVAFF